MFARLSTVAVAFALFSGVLAGPTKIEYEQCDGGIVQCCKTTQDTKNLNQEAKGDLANLLQLELKQITGLAGAECTGVNVLAVGGGQTCTQQKVCCSNNNISEFCVAASSNFVGLTALITPQTPPLLLAAHRSMYLFNYLCRWQALSSLTLRLVLNATKGTSSLLLGLFYGFLRPSSLSS